MLRIRSAGVRTLVFGSCLLFGAAACAAVPVVESKGQDRVPSSERSPAVDPSGRARASGDAPGKAPGDTSGGAAGNAEIDAEAAPSPAAGGGGLVFEVQALRQQVQELRGQLEEQNHRIERMEKEQRDRYLDIDRRLRPGTVPALGVAERAIAEPPAVADATEPADPDERAAYAKAVQLTRGKNYQAAIDAFTRQLVDYPGGAYEANAFYWLGELYLALPQPQLERARQAFAQVVNLYPENAKVPDALYKLAIVYGKLGDANKAREYMTRVREQYPGSPASGLAEAYLARDR